MILAYIDESGDPGTGNSPTKYFILSCILVRSTNWNLFLDESVDFRKSLRDHYQIKLRNEIHVNEMFNNKQFNHLTYGEKLSVCKKSIDFINDRKYLRTFFVVLDKYNFQDSSVVFRTAWKYLIQRIENFASRENKSFMLCPDFTSKDLTRTLRAMRRYNPIPQRYGKESYKNVPLTTAIEDPFYKESHHTFFVQFADLISYFMKQQYQPSGRFKKRKKDRFMLQKRLKDNLLYEVSGAKNGIVKINRAQTY